MKEVLTHSSMGYYTTRDVFGAQGDFITSPEISQIFGELLAVWCLDQWYKMGRPAPLQIVELGPGRGTLADDLLRVLAQFQDVKEHVSAHFVEISPILSKLQIKKLCNLVEDENNGSWKSDNSVCYTGISHHGFPCSWYLQLQDVPRKFSIFIAHEFFDALPVHRFQKTPSGWREVLVDINDSNNNLRFVLSRNPTPASLMYVKENEASNELEISPQSYLLVRDLASRIVEDGGVVLIADYGHEGEKTDTFRGFKNHQLVEPLSDPGNCDLTADVNFAYLAAAAKEKDVIVYGPIPQKTFLTNLGICLRLEQLVKNREDEVEKNLRSGCDMLLNPNQMGDRFKFLAIFPSVMKRIFDRFPVSGFNPP